MSNENPPQVIINTYNFFIGFGFNENIINDIIRITLNDILTDLRLPLSHDWNNVAFSSAFEAKIYEIILHLDKDSEFYSEELLNNLLKGNTKILSRENRFKWNSYWKKYEVSENEIMKIKKIGNCNIKCKNCGSNNTNVEFVQTRSADEGMTKFFQCLNCGTHWRK